MTMTAHWQADPDVSYRRREARRKEGGKKEGDQPSPKLSKRRNRHKERGSGGRERVNARSSKGLWTAPVRVNLEEISKGEIL